MRCMVRQAIKIGGINGIALTKLDVLDGFDEVKICTAYRRGGAIYDYFPAGTSAQAEIEPVYETAEGWRESTRGARSWADLPATAIKYIRRLEELIERAGGAAFDQPRARRHGAGPRPVRRLIGRARTRRAVSPKSRQRRQRRSARATPAGVGRGLSARRAWSRI